MSSLFVAMFIVFILVPLISYLYNPIRKHLYIKRHPEFKIFLETYDYLYQRKEDDCSVMGNINKNISRLKEDIKRNIDDVELRINKNRCIQDLVEDYSVFRKDSKKMERCMEKFCEINKDIIRDAYELFKYDLDYREKRWAEISIVRSKVNKMSNL